MPGYSDVLYVSPSRHELIQKGGIHKLNPLSVSHPRDVVLRVFPATGFAIIPSSETAEEELSINSVMELPPPFGYVGIFVRFFYPS